LSNLGSQLVHGDLESDSERCDSVLFIEVCNWHSRFSTSLWVPHQRGRREKLAAALKGRMEQT
jgi:hypothetical protein